MFFFFLKTSTDFNETDMTVVKRVTDGVSKPLAYICRLSFETNTFPNKVKIAKEKGKLFFILVSDWI